ncbi:uncharacterized protein LOC129919329 [Episyrphus balteatus]|uniref:uncharacterized protein LOC129919329 n=1 Tax=Episyrphus balteatus TaxID=286459 RepID=UPI0024850A04|nr:uncharacterized protein LOC129919329 [Episyrphus balteatus]
MLLVLACLLELAIRLNPLIKNCTSSVKNSQHFISIIKDIHLRENEVMVSFDVTSLFTNVPIIECIEVIKSQLSTSDDDSKLLELLHLCLTSGYFLYKEKFYLQIDGVAMGSPVAPIIADIWMQYFKMKALETSPIKPVIWKRYVDDTFCILNKNDVDTFLNHLNSVHSKIQFTMEIEENNTLAFLDVKVIKNQDGTLGHTVYRKNTHTDRYLHAASHHHPEYIGSEYIGETKRSISTRLNEHIKAIQKNEVTKSAICEHLAYNTDHFIRFDQAKSISTERFYVPRLVREAIEIKKCNNFNRDQSFNLSGAWDPLINELKKKLQFCCVWLLLTGHMLFVTKTISKMS